MLSLWDFLHSSAEQVLGYLPCLFPLSGGKETDAIVLNHHCYKYLAQLFVTIETSIFHSKEQSV